MKRIMLKLSGEALAGDKGTGFDDTIVHGIAEQIKKMPSIMDDETQVGIVIGGGNFWRGTFDKSIDRTKSDQLGMLASIMNCIYVSDVFRSTGMKTSVFAPFPCGETPKVFNKDEVNKCFAEGEVVFFAAGTGHPYFSTDTGVILRAVQMSANVVLLAKSIDGVYDSDPATNPDAKKYNEISLDEVIKNNLGVMDLSASIMARDNKIPLHVFALNEPDGILKAANGDTSFGTKVTV